MDNKDRVNILLVDDQPGKLLSYEVMLAELEENLVAVSSAKEALAYLLKSDVAVILVDVCMPELDGFELAEMIREHPRFQKTAIIFISAIHLTESDYLKGYAAGAVDYLSVPVVPELLRAQQRTGAAGRGAHRGAGAVLRPVAAKRAGPGSGPGGRQYGLLGFQFGLGCVVLGRRPEPYLRHGPRHLRAQRRQGPERHPEDVDKIREHLLGLDEDNTT